MEIETEIGKSVDRIFSFINVLKIIVDVPKFQNWLDYYHKMENFDDLFVGYKFFIEVVFSDLLLSIHLDSNICLEEDISYKRAHFVGEKIDDIPNTCEKIILLKNLFKRLKIIRKSKSWKQINDAVESVEDLISIFDFIYEKYVFTRKKLTKDEALRIATIQVTYNFLNDTSTGIPHTYPTSILYPNYTVKYAEDSYKGYTYCLQYLWYILLGQVQFENSTIKELHNAHEIYLNEVNKKIAKEQEIFGIYYDEKTLLTLKKWLSLDYYFSVVNEEIIKGLKLTNYRIDTILKLKNTFNKEELSYLLTKEGLKEPEYLTNGNSLYFRLKKLNYYFYWYKVNVLDSQKITMFNGFSAFLSTLIGRIELNRRFRIKDKVYILKIRHTPDSFGDSGCSYAILIENYGPLTDYSGWLVFYNCLVVDKNGNPFTIIDIQTEEILQEYIHSGKIEYHEFMIDEGTFRQYLEKQNVSSIFGTIKDEDEQGNEREIYLSEIKESLDQFVGDVKGKFFEYLFYNWLSETTTKSYSRIICDFDFNKSGEQIDIFAESDEEIQIFECKVSVKTEKVNETLDQICKKRNLFENNKKKVKTCLVVYFPFKTPNREKFEHEGIEICDNFQVKIYNWEKLSNDDKKKINDSIFKYNLDDLL
jgi:hypothetical protein